MLGLCIAGLSATPAHAAEKAIWGPLELPSGASAFPMYKQLGVDTLQLQVNWNSVAPARPSNPSNPADSAYRWPTTVTGAVTQARRHGIRLALLVTGTPGWANGGRSSIWAPNDPSDFGTFLAAAARRYPSVHRWMIWGEPNMAVRFQPQTVDGSVSARTYAPLLDAAYGALKRVSPSNVVIGGMTWTGGDVKPSAFVRAMRMPDGRPPRLDWFGHNPYPFRYPELARGPVGDFRDVSDLDTFSREIDAAYRGHRRTPVKLWLSEFMIQSGQRSESFDIFVSRADQAAWLAAGFRIAGRLGRRVTGIGWFSLVDQPPAAGSSHWGLLTSSGARKPSWRAFYDVPSERFSPAVSVTRTASVRKLRRDGLGVRLRVRSSGRHIVQLRRGARVVRTRRTTRSALLRLTSRSARPGTYTVRVLSPRGVTVSRSVRVRR